MKNTMSFLTIDDTKTLDQIKISDWLMVSTSLAQSSLDEVDFKYVMMKCPNTTVQLLIKEYILLKTGMFEMWEVLYHYE